MPEEVLETVMFLPGDSYSQNKTKFKKLRERFNLKFDRDAFLGVRTYRWSNEAIEIIGEFVKDVSGVTIHGALIVREYANVQGFKSEILQLTIECGGKEITSEEYDEMKSGGLKEFDEHWLSRLASEERKAKNRGYEHSPLLNPMIAEYIAERANNFGKSDKTFNDVLLEIEQEPGCGNVSTPGYCDECENIQRDVKKVNGRNLCPVCRGE